MQTTPTIYDRETLGAARLIPGSRDPDGWHAIRANSIGASEAAAVFGEHAYVSPLQLARRKREPELHQVPDSRAMATGRALEPVLREEAAELLRAQGLAVEACPGSWASDECPRLACSLDGLARSSGDEPEILELKTTRHGDLIDELPLLDRGYGASSGMLGRLAISYWWQVQAQLAVTGLYAARLVVWHLPSDRIGIARITAGADARHRLRTEVGPWWDRHVAGGFDPEPIAADLPELARTPADPTIPPIILEGIEWDQALADYREARATSRLAEERADQIQALVMAELGEATEADWSGARVTWRSVESSRIDVARLRAERPDVAAEYQQISASRRFVLARGAR